VGFRVDGLIVDLSEFANHPPGGTFRIEANPATSALRA